MLTAAILSGGASGCAAWKDIVGRLCAPFGGRPKAEGGSKGQMVSVPFIIENLSAYWQVYSTS